ncbi:MAG: efflux transporter outer membrane subunit [Magnetococcales bacterium]|nr:efflux transporter outer membrane subunit [Magnetococcales bacterium]
MALLVGCLLLCAGCRVGPDYQPPATALPAQWSVQEGSTLLTKAEMDRQWWKNFNDPILTQLIDKAAQDNFDLKIAEARLAGARASVAQADATLLPSGSIRGTATREANQMALPGGNTTPFAALLHTPYNIFQSGFDASWELDLFGGHQRAKESAEAQRERVEASRDTVRVSLLAEVARTYVIIRQQQARLAIAEALITADERTLAIAQQRFAEGQAPRLEVIRAEAALEQAQTALPDLRNRVAQAEYSLDLLLGEQPGAAHALVSTDGPVPDTHLLVLATPAVVIAQRPDIRAAERQLAVATAQQGVAVAQFFPNISLSGFFGALSTSTSDLTSGGNHSWLTTGGISWPILSYGSLSANLDAADAQQQEAMATYQKAIIAALSDVERALAAYTEQEKSVHSLVNEFEQRRRARAVAQERYQEGATSRLEVLEVDRTFYTTQDRLITARAECAQDLIAVYKSLGGGWVE